MRKLSKIYKYQTKAIDKLQMFNFNKYVKLLLFGYMLIQFLCHPEKFNCVKIKLILVIFYYINILKNKVILAYYDVKYDIKYITSLCLD